MLFVVRLILFGACHFWGAAASEKGCQLWNLKRGTKDVCCQTCKTGNRLVQECGPDPEALCVPCERGTFTPVPGQSCQKCKTCSSMQVLKQQCTSSSDTVCSCLPGFHCEDTNCTRCIQHCGLGQELTREGTCRRCPPGTFRNEEHNNCIEWSKSCANAKFVIVRNGTAFSDIKCDPFDVEEDQLVMVATAVGCFMLGLVPSGFLIWTWSKAKKKEEDAERAAEGETEKRSDLDSETSPTLCRVGQPEQEQGSISSIDSENSDKPLVSA